ncbi:Gfo/Idh/MocA family oxidoreductase [Acerihabitans sp.]|uniref:Gfo/Idh/MocA family protein n=1 Tax=Acerihabitans sp. TaxID=2811394 RepID=UPI002ED81BDA
MKAGIVGLGFRMANVAKEFKQADADFTITGFADPAPAGLETLTQFGIDAGRGFSTLGELLAAGGFDMLMVGSPNYLHLEHIRAGLEAGLIVFTEKPVVINEEQTLALAELVRQYGSDRIIVGLVLRYSPLYVDLLRAQAQNQLGEITSIEACEHIPPWHGAFFMRDWRRFERFAGAYMLEKCCHDLDLYQGLVGARAMSVASFGGRKSFTAAHEPHGPVITAASDVYHRKPSGWHSTDNVFTSDADIIDYQTAIVEYATGATLSFHANLNVPDYFRRFCVIGSDGMAEGDFVRNYFRVHDARSGDRLEDKTYEGHGDGGHYGADTQMARGVVDHLLRGVPLKVSIIDAMEAGLTAIKIDEARKQKCLIDLTECWQRFDRALGRTA